MHFVNALLFENSVREKHQNTTISEYSRIILKFRLFGHTYKMCIFNDSKRFLEESVPSVFKECNLITEMTILVFNLKLKAFQRYLQIFPTTF